MRIQLLSDAHNELRKDSIFLAPLPSPPDLILLAGDMGIRSEGVVAAHRQVFETYGTNIPTVYINGNHEYVHSGEDVYKTIANSRMVSKMLRQCGSGVHFLENESVELTLAGEPVRILGCTLWTDFSFGGKHDRLRAMLNARQHISDLQGAAIRDHGGQSVTPEAVYQMHLESARWLEDMLSRKFAGKTIVITHFAPHCVSNPRYAPDAITSYFYTDMTPVIEKYQPDLWVWGHTHFSQDFFIGRTRMVSNQIGYPGKEHKSGYRPHLEIEL